MAAASSLSAVSRAAVDRHGQGRCALGQPISFADIDGDEVKHVATIIETFTADASTQAINVVLEAGRNGGIAGLILTSPEPRGLGDRAEPLGTLNVFDIFGFFAATGAADLGAADITGDGLLNIFDIFGFFELFGAGCGTGCGCGAPGATSSVAPRLASERTLRKAATPGGCCESLDNHTMSP